MLPLTYEDLSDTIENELKKRRGRWRCRRLDFEEAAQLCRIRIFTKFDKWDQTLPFVNWANRLITNCLINIVRDNVVRYERPCVKCAFNDGNGLCRVTPSKIQCGECKFYREWEQKGKHAFDVKRPVSIENHTDEVSNMQGDFFNVGEAKIHLEVLLKDVLTPKELKVFKWMFIDNRSDEFIATKMGFTTNEPGRKPGYRMLKNYRDAILKKAKEVLENSDIQ